MLLGQERPSFKLMDEVFLFLLQVVAKSLVRWLVPLVNTCTARRYYGRPLDLAPVKGRVLVEVF